MPKPIFFILSIFTYRRPFNGPADYKIKKFPSIAHTHMKDL